MEPGQTDTGRGTHDRASVRADRADPRRGPLCLNCNYPLDGLPEYRCPECGRTYDPDDPETANHSGWPMPAWARWLARPVGWGVHMMTALVVANALYHASLPLNTFSRQLSAMLTGALLLTVWAARVFARALAVYGYGRPRRDRRRGWGTAMVVPAVIVLWMALPPSWVSGIAFRLSAPALERFAQRAAAGQISAGTTGWVGCYRVTLDSVVPDGVWIYTNWDYESRCGFFYCMRGQPKDDGETSAGQTGYRHLRGQWYVYYDLRWPLRALGTPPATQPCGP